MAARKKGRGTVALLERSRSPVAYGSRCTHVLDSPQAGEDWVGTADHPIRYRADKRSGSVTVVPTGSVGQSALLSTDRMHARTSLSAEERIWIFTPS